MTLHMYLRWFGNSSVAIVLRVVSVCSLLVLSIAARTTLGHQVDALAISRKNQLRVAENLQLESVIRRESEALFGSLLTESSRLALMRLRWESTIRQLANNYDSTLVEWVIDARRAVASHPELQTYRYGITGASITLEHQSLTQALSIIHGVSVLPGFSSNIEKCSLSQMDNETPSAKIQTRCEITLLDITAP